MGKAVLTSAHNLCFEQKYEKYQSFFYLKIFIFVVVKCSVYLNRLVFVMSKLRSKSSASKWASPCENIPREKTNYIIKQLLTIEELDMTLTSTIEYQY